jgi:hypothetical protein
MVRLRLACAALRIAAFRFDRRPVPLGIVLALRRLAHTRDAFLPVRAADTWAVGPDGLEFLRARLRRLAPSTVLELGCGDSTILMARVLAEIHGDDDVHVISIEQDARFAAECRDRLAAAGLNAAVTDCDLVMQPATQGETLSYDLGTEFVTGLLPTPGPDLIVIDGPSGGRLVRYPVLPGLQPYLTRETPFLLHDGLRDYELRVAQMWRRLPGVTVEGVFVVDEGFVAGTVKPLAEPPSRL